MFFKYTQIGNRVQASDVISTYNQQSYAVVEPPKSSQPPSPQANVNTSTTVMSRRGWIYRVNRTAIFQKLFAEPGTADLPVFLRGGAVDFYAYRGVMVLSVVGIGLTLWSIGRIATGNMKKKD